MRFHKKLEAFKKDLKNNKLIELRYEKSSDKTIVGHGFKFENGGYHKAFWIHNETDWFFWELKQAGFRIYKDKKDYLILKKYFLGKYITKLELIIKVLFKKT